MIKLGFKLIVFILLLINTLEAYSINRTYWANGKKIYNITCNNGNIKEIDYDPNNKLLPYWINGKGFKNIENAIYFTCKTKNNIVTLKNGALIVNRKSDIEICLKSNYSFKLCKTMARMGSKKYFLTNGSSNVKILKEYKKSNFIDSFYKISDGNGIYYVRDKDIK